MNNVFIGGIGDKYTAVGTFYTTAMTYSEKFKIGGNQKLQKIIGENLFYKKGKDWYWNNNEIINMSIPKLKKLTDKIRTKL